VQHTSVLAGACRLLDASFTAATLVYTANYLRHIIGLLLVYRRRTLDFMSD
jgi:hypothetical protein